MSDTAIEEAAILVSSAIREGLIIENGTGALQGEPSNPTHALFHIAAAINGFTEAYEARTRLLDQQGRKDHAARDPGDKS